MGKNKEQDECLKWFDEEDPFELNEEMKFIILILETVAKKMKLQIM
ncbi:hypothetical protein J27TS8_22860 [Robertmurraya siralis]|uniref:Uncharacterized protein n=1 Tax=Robertmurraya siralis TaxID=77777 RepID=A0A919WHU1_9BACI|nr:hypothetical protein [Robertmurraya siralis]GIN62293.1 hypothetical protein J27TS8_22860 [Robertmurraya siralis]